MAGGGAFVLFKYVGIIAAIGIITANVLTVYEQIDSDDSFYEEEDSIVRVLALCFNAFTGVLIVMALLEASLINIWFKFLSHWSILGGAMIYLAVMTRAVKSAVPFKDDTLNDVADILVYVLAGTGALFAVLGCCLGDALRGK